MNKKLFIFILLLLSFMMSEAQNPSLLWQFNTNDMSFGQTAAGDIDNDGKLELVFGCYRNDSMIYAINAEDGSLLWKFNARTTGAEGCNDVAPIIYDVDGNGSMEVIVPASCNPKTFCFNGIDGSIKWQVNTRGSDSPPTIADIDNDGKPEILHGEFGGYVICINAENGSIAWEIPVDLHSWIQTAPTIVDLNHDGQLDFVVATWNSTSGDTNKVYAYQGNNQQLLWTFPLKDVVYHGTAISNLDADPYPELVLGDYSGTLYCLNGENGSPAWEYTYDPTYYVGGPASIADINGDGDCEIVFSAWFKVIALKYDGTPLWNYSIPGYESSFRGAALADVDGDHLPDAVFGTGGGLLTALKGTDGSEIWTVDLEAIYGSTFEIDHAPIVADLNKNDTLDVFIIGGKAEYPNFSTNYGRAYALELPFGGGYGPEWLMFQQNIRRSSSICDSNSSAVYEYNVNNDYFSIFPNPNSGDIFLDIKNLKEKPELIEIYDVTQRLIFAKSAKDCCNDAECNVKLKHIQSGIYMIRLHTAHSIFSAKMLVTAE